MSTFLEIVWIMASFPELGTTGEKHMEGEERKS